MPILELIRSDNPGPQRVGEVLAFARAQADFHLAALQVPGGPVVEHGVAEDVLVRLSGGQVPAVASGNAPDDGCNFSFEVQVLAARRNTNYLARAGHRVWVREIERGRLIPFGHHTRHAVDALPHALDVFLERHKIPHSGGHQRGQQLHVRQRNGPAGTDGLSGKDQRFLQTNVQENLNALAGGQGIAVSAGHEAGLRPAVVVPASNLDHKKSSLGCVGGGD